MLDTFYALWIRRTDKNVIPSNSIVLPSGRVYGEGMLVPERFDYMSSLIVLFIRQDVLPHLTCNLGSEVITMMSP